MPNEFLTAGAATLTALEAKAVRTRGIDNRLELAERRERVGVLESRSKILRAFSALNFPDQKWQKHLDHLAARCVTVSLSSHHVPV